VTFVVVVVAVVVVVDAFDVGPLAGKWCCAKRF
jgi:hypothetical protein